MKDLKLGLILASLGLLTLGVASAKGEGIHLAEFQVNGKQLLAFFTGQQEGESTLLIPGRNLTIRCLSRHIEAGSEIINSKEALVKFSALSCTAVQHTTGKQLLCTIDNPLWVAKVLPVGHSGSKKYVLFRPDSPATLFTTVRMLGESCPLPEENPVQGGFYAEVDQNGTSKPLLLLSEAIQLLVQGKLPEDSLKFGGFSAYFKASIALELTGAHTGLKFGVA